MDLGALAALAEAPERLRTFRRACLEAWNLAEEMPKPVICAIQGACLGGALELALACDLRVLAADAIVGMPETRIGLIPDVGGSSRLPQVVGLGRAKELIMTGKLIGAEEAERIGLANRVAPRGGARRGGRPARRRAARLRADRGRAGQAGDGRLRAPRALHDARARGRRAGALRRLRPTSPRASARSGRSASRSSEHGSARRATQAFHSTGPAVSRCEPSGRPSTRCTSRAHSSSAPRSIPVSAPISWSIETTSSVATLPVAPAGTGQPPSSPKLDSKERTPAA